MLVSNIFALISIFAMVSCCEGSLVTLVQNTRSVEVCCREENLMSCVDVVVDPRLLAEPQIDILGRLLTFSNKAGLHGSVFKTETGDEAVITYNPQTDSLFGSLKTSLGESYAIEKCHGGHVWKQYDVDSFGEHESEEDNEDLKVSKERKEKSESMTGDREDIVTYSVMIYFTPAFAAITADIPNFVDQVITETNQGYINSQMPVRISLHCIEAATISEVQDGSSFLSNFKSMKGSLAKLRNSADCAVLLTDIYDSSKCGIGYLNSLYTGNTVSIARKSCALGYYTFGHEIGRF